MGKNGGGRRSSRKKGSKKIERIERDRRIKILKTREVRR